MLLARFKLLRECGLRRHFSESFKDQTGLHKIDTTKREPLELFQQWFQEHIEADPQNQFYKVCCVATASKDGDVSARNLILRRIDQDGFVLLTDNRSLKARNIDENPQASLVFLWNKIISNSNFTRQVRVKGKVEQLPNTDSSNIYETEPLFAKIRAQICHQGQPVSWDSLEKQHNSILDSSASGEPAVLRKPDYVVTYKIFPQYFEFYEVLGSKIADRLLFTRAESSWKVTRIAA